MALTKSFEGCRLQTYRDVRGIPTIGYGHTGADVHMGMEIDQAQADAYLLEDIQTAVRAVNALVHVPVSQNQFDAMVDFTYNVGQGNFRASTLLVKVNAGDFAGAAGEFIRWDKAGGQVVAGLLRRREAERDLFLS